MIDWSNIAIIIVALLVNVPSWYMLRQNQRKADVESKSIEDQITDRVLQRTQTLMDAQDRRISELEQEFNALLRGAWALHAQLKDNHIEPRYTPPRDLSDMQKTADDKPSGTHKTSGFGRGNK